MIEHPRCGEIRVEDSADLPPVVVGCEPHHRGGLFLLPLDVVSCFGKYRGLTNRSVQADDVTPKNEGINIATIMFLLRMTFV